MNERIVQVFGMVGAIALVVGGSLLTGYLPNEPASQLLAGAVIVAGFVLGFVAYGGLDEIELQ